MSPPGHLLPTGQLTHALRHDLFQLVAARTAYFRLVSACFALAAPIASTPKMCAATLGAGLLRAMFASTGEIGILPCTHPTYRDPLLSLCSPVYRGRHRRPPFSYVAEPPVVSNYNSQVVASHCELRSGVLCKICCKLGVLGGRLQGFTYSHKTSKKQGIRCSNTCCREGVEVGRHLNGGSRRRDAQIPP